MPLRFARLWLTLACWLTIATGLIAFGGSHPSIDGPWMLLLDIVRWPMDGHPATLEPMAQTLSAISGGLMVGWGSLMLWLCRMPNTPYGPMAGALVIWCIVDSVGSALSGLHGNIVLNVLFLVLFVIPLLRLRRMVGPSRSAS